MTSLNTETEQHYLKWNEVMLSRAASPKVFKIKCLFWNNFRVTENDQNVQRSPIYPTASFPISNILY